MLLEELQRCISDMNEIQQLEQASNDSQKQNKADASYVAEVSNNDKVIQSIENSRQYVKFAPSTELKRLLKQVLNDLQDCINTGFVQEARIKFLQNETKTVKDTFTAEWSVFFAGLSDKRISMLTTVKEITPNRNKTDYAINKIKNGAAISYDGSDKVRQLSEGIAEADQILEGLRLNDEIMMFLDKVSEGKATVLDLTDNVVAWIKKENIANKFAIGFKS